MKRIVKRIVLIIFYTQWNRYYQKFFKLFYVTEYTNLSQIPQCYSMGYFVSNLKIISFVFSIMPINIFYSYVLYINILFYIMRLYYRSILNTRWIFFQKYSCFNFCNNTKRGKYGRLQTFISTEQIMEET